MKPIKPYPAHINRKAKKRASSLLSEYVWPSAGNNLDLLNQSNHNMWAQMNARNVYGAGSFNAPSPTSVWESLGCSALAEPPSPSSWVSTNTEGPEPSPAKALSSAQGLFSRIQALTSRVFRSSRRRA